MQFFKKGADEGRQVRTSGSSSRQRPSDWKGSHASAAAAAAESSRLSRVDGGDSMEMGDGVTPPPPPSSSSHTIGDREPQGSKSGWTLMPTQLHPPRRSTSNWHPESPSLTLKKGLGIVTELKVRSLRYPLLHVQYTADDRHSVEP